MANLSLSTAKKIIEAAIKRSEELECKMDIAVVDAGANLKAFVRMDDAWLGSIDIAMKKARTARYFDMNSGDIGTLSQPGGPLYQIEVSNNGLISFPGGIPLKNNDGEIIGLTACLVHAVQGSRKRRSTGNRVESVAKYGNRG